MTAEQWSCLESCGVLTASWFVSPFVSSSRWQVAIEPSVVRPVERAEGQIGGNRVGRASVVMGREGES